MENKYLTFKDLTERIQDYYLLPKHLGRLAKYIPKFRYRSDYIEFKFDDFEGCSFNNIWPTEILSKYLALRKAKDEMVICIRKDSPFTYYKITDIDNVFTSDQFYMLFYLEKIDVKNGFSGDLLYHLD